MPERQNRATQNSQSQQVDSYIQAMKHPLKDVVEELRAIILSADSRIGEEVKWNAPAFFYTGPMAEFEAKDHKRHVVVFNLFKKDCVRLVFLAGASIDDQSGLLVGDYSDGRRLALFSSLRETQVKKTALKSVIRKLVSTLEKKELETT